MPARGWDQRFFSTTRGQVVAQLQRAPRTVEELAAALGITDNAVRSHLSSLERDGLVCQSGMRRTQAKPAFMYDITPAAEHLFPDAYASVLGHVLDAAGERLDPGALVALLREVGERLAADSGVPTRREAPERIKLAISALHEFGSTLEIDDAASQRGKVRLRGYSCPLAAVVAQHPEVCQVVESFLSKVIGARVTECCERAARPRCSFDILLRRQRIA